MATPDRRGAAAVRDLTPEELDALVRQVVRIAQPERIILFGSAARGEMGRDSDVDLLVIKAGQYSRRELAARLYTELDVDAAVDVVIITPEELARYRDSPALIYRAALSEGREVYRAA